MFDLSSLQFNSEYPALTSIIMTILFSLLLGILLAFTYDRTSREVNRPDSFLQALILITIVASMIIQAIGDSVARGLGMLGALSIIRFRTTVRDSRNIVFMFAALGAGIACGVFGFTIAIAGTLAFSLTAFLLHYSSFTTSQNITASLKVQLDKSLTDKETLEKILRQYSKKFILNKQQTSLKKDTFKTSYTYDVRLKNPEKDKQLVEAIQQVNGMVVQRFTLERNKAETI